MIAGGLLATASMVWAADVSAGKDVYMTKCKTCHAADGQGNPGLAKAMKVEMRPLGSSRRPVDERCRFRSHRHEGQRKNEAGFACACRRF